MKQSLQLLLIASLLNISLQAESKIMSGSNHLIHESSPYLLQHAHNPVDWYPWSEEALAKARKENKPIFLSVGYSACHWCHVMEHECFEDAEVAKLLNEYFISIKVDREERPDIDDIYMTAVQIMTGRGGWPMSVFLTPDQHPFYAGTYFPKLPRYGQPGFMEIVRHLGELWQKDENKIRSEGQRLVEHLKKTLDRGEGGGQLPSHVLTLAMESLENHYDDKHGGFGSAPKFPPSLSLDLYIEALRDDTFDAAKKKVIKDHLLQTLSVMCQGGMYDQIGGGFHRYSTDENWLVPHFEKMLYDNGLLAKTYLEAAMELQNPTFKRIGLEICEYIEREMTDKSGAFYSTTDADSEGMEGKFFLWDYHELEKILGETDGKSMAKLFQISAEAIGDVEFEGGTPPHSWFSGRIPHLEMALETSALPREKIATWREKCYQARKSRVPPARDEKVLSSWNGLMNQAYTSAYRITGEKKWLQIASDNLDFIWREMQKDGRLFATWKDGRPRHVGTLEDYANVSAAFLQHFQVSGHVQSLQRATLLANSALQHFSAGKGKAFFYTADDAGELIVRSKNLYDGSVPSANSVLAGVLLKLDQLIENPVYGAAAQGIFLEYSDYLNQGGSGFAKLVRALHWAQSSGREIVLVGADDHLQGLVLQKLRDSDIFITEKSGVEALLKGRVPAKEPILYICRSGMCKMPILGKEKILSALGD